MRQRWYIQVSPEVVRGAIRGVPGAPGALGSGTGNIIHGKYTAAEPLPYWELLNMDQVLQSQVGFFKKSQCCCGARGSAPTMVTLTPLRLPTQLVGWQKRVVCLGVPSCVDPIQQSVRVELPAAPAGKQAVKPRVCKSC